MATRKRKRLCALIVYSILKRRKTFKRNRSVWIKEWLRKRANFTHTNLLQELTIYPIDFRNYLRMDEDTYLQLLNTVSPLITKEDTKFRTAISPHERLTATLCYLARGRTYEDLKFVTCISPQSLRVIIPETCRAIFQCLAKDYMRVSWMIMIFCQFAACLPRRIYNKMCVGP